MVAIVGCVLSYALLASGLPGGDVAPVLADLCAPGMGTCAMAPTGPRALEAEAAEHPPTYATPAEVDCRAGAAAAATLGADPLLLYGGCERPAFDFRYRISRFPESERPNGGFAPQRARRVLPATETSKTPATCAGLPAGDHSGPTLGASPPAAIYALTLLPPPAEGAGSSPREASISTRVVEPLERPPRQSLSPDA